jgi:hypothetical protein
VVSRSVRVVAVPIGVHSAETITASGMELTLSRWNENVILTA